MRKFFVLFIALLVAVGAVVPAIAQADAVVAAIEEYQAEIPPYNLIDAEALGTLLIERDVILLDVREVEEYEAGHIAGAFNIPIRELGQNLALLPDLDAEIYVICQGGARAMLATAALHTLGYDNAINLKGGMGAWEGEGFPVTTDAFVPDTEAIPEAINSEVLDAVDGYLSTLPEGFDLIRADGLNVELVENPDIFLLDTRSPDEWDTGYIAGAEFIWVDEFMSNRDLLPADLDTPIVVYCGSSYRAGIVTVWLRLLGYTNVRNLVGGINAWVAAGLPLEGAPPAEVESVDLETLFNDYLVNLPGNFNAVRVPDVEEALAGDTTPILLDVRTVDEYAEGHLEGAINIPLNELTANLDLLPDLDAEIIVYCGSGHRSALAMGALNLLGYDNAVSLLGGVRAWMGSDLPVTDVVTTAEAGTAPEFNPEVFAAVDAYMTSVPQGYFVVRSDDLNVELAESDIFLLDVRTDGEWSDGYIGGAVHIPFDTLFADVSMLPETDATIVIYDNPTHRSSVSMMLLQLLGYEDVRTLGGGYGAWTNAGLPVETN
jgi:rhodanese-related sulfurtransferase